MFSPTMWVYSLYLPLSCEDSVSSWKHIETCLPQKKQSRSVVFSCLDYLRLISAGVGDLSSAILEWTEASYSDLRGEVHLNFSGKLQSGQIAQRGSNFCHRGSVNTTCPCCVCPSCGCSPSAMSQLDHCPEATLLTSPSRESQVNLPEAIGQWLNSTALLIGSLGADFSCLAYLYLFKSNLLQSILIL